MAGICLVLLLDILVVVNVNMAPPQSVNGVQFDPLHLGQLLGSVQKQSAATHDTAMKEMRNLSHLLNKIQTKRAAMPGMSGHSSSIGSGVSGPLEQYHGPRHVNKWVDTAMRILGLPPSFKPGIENMVMHESGGNPNATNNWDSNAAAGTPSMGLMQTIQPTFNAYALPGHHQILNPIDNLLAGLNYAEHRYGKHMIKAGGRHDASGNYIGY